MSCLRVFQERTGSDRWRYLSYSEVSFSIWAKIAVPFLPLGNFTYDFWQILGLRNCKERDIIFVDAQGTPTVEERSGEAE